jgi:hypothetical protein
MNRSTAGRKARQPGAQAEYELIKLLRERGFTVLKVRDKPYDLIYWDGQDIYFAQVKSYILSPKELQKAQELLQDATYPKGAILEVWMKNRKKGCRMNRGEPKKWIVEIGKEV